MTHEKTAAAAVVAAETNSVRFVLSVSGKNYCCGRVKKYVRRQKRKSANVRR